MYFMYKCLSYFITRHFLYLCTDLVSLSDLENLSRELESKASTDDLKLLAQQQAGLASSVNGMAEWLAVRPETMDGSKGTVGAIFTKFK
jgi:hypothetical protein